MMKVSVILLLMTALTADAHTHNTHTHTVRPTTSFTLMRWWNKLHYYYYYYYYNYSYRYFLRLRNDLYCVEWGVKLYSLTHYRYFQTYY